MLWYHLPSSMDIYSIINIWKAYLCQAELVSLASPNPHAIVLRVWCKVSYLSSLDKSFPFWGLGLPVPLRPWNLGGPWASRGVSFDVFLEVSLMDQTLYLLLNMVAILCVMSFNLLELAPSTRLWGMSSKCRTWRYNYLRRVFKGMKLSTVFPPRLNSILSLTYELYIF